MLEGGGPGWVSPPARLLCPSTKPAAVSKHETGAVTKQTTGAREGVRGGFPPPGTAAVSKHETGTMTKQTTDALQFMVVFALREEGGCYTSATISHFVMPWEAGGASPNQHASDLYYNF